MDLTFGIGQAIAGVGQYFGQKAQAKQSGINLQNQIAHEQRLAQYRYAKDLEMWERANKYNEPTQQMARLREAGLNPALMYGKATGANVAAGQLPKYQQAAADHSQVESVSTALGVLGMFQDMELRQAQVDNVKAATKNTEERTASETMRAILLNEQGISQRAKNVLAQMQSEKASEILKYQLEGLKQANLKTKQDIAHSAKTMESIDKDLAIKDIVKNLKQADLDWIEAMKATDLGKGIFSILKMIGMSR